MTWHESPLPRIRLARKFDSGQTLAAAPWLSSNRIKLFRSLPIDSFNAAYGERLGVYNINSSPIRYANAVPLHQLVLDFELSHIAIGTRQIPVSIKVHTFIYSPITCKGYDDSTWRIGFRYLGSILGRNFFF